MMADKRHYLRSKIGAMRQILIGCLSRRYAIHFGQEKEASSQCGEDTPAASC